MAQVDIRTEGSVLHLHVTRPEKYNALSLEMYAALGEGLHRLGTRSAV